MQVASSTFSVPSSVAFANITINSFSFIEIKIEAIAEGVFYSSSYYRKINFRKVRWIVLGKIAWLQAKRRSKHVYKAPVLFFVQVENARHN